MESFVSKPPVKIDKVNEVENKIRNLMRLRKTGVYAPATKILSLTTKTGEHVQIDTTLNNVKNAISRGFNKLKQKN